jgi:hypothetical protein
MTASTMKYRLALLLACSLSASSAAAYVYTLGPNYVNMAGSTCRPPVSGNENNLYHDSGSTTVKAGVSLQRLFCPIARRGTSFYGGRRLDGGIPEPPAATQYKVNLGGVTVRGGDSSTSYRLTCFTFGARKSDQSLFFGASKALCGGTTLGCNPSDIGSGWTGWNTMRLSAPSGFSSVETVNFGVTCDVPASSTIQYLESWITPN